jgi:hypothetical protein
VLAQRPFLQRGEEILKTLRKRLRHVRHVAAQQRLTSGGLCDPVCSTGTLVAATAITNTATPAALVPATRTGSACSLMLC